MCTWSCAGSAPPVEPAEAPLSATLLERSAPAMDSNPPSPSHAARASSTAAGSPHDAPFVRIASSALVAPKTLRRCAPQSELPDGITFFRSADRGLHVPARLTPEPAKHEARERRTSERPRVGCCEELGGG